MCVSPYIFMYKRRDKNINFVHISQTKCSIKYISNIHEGMMQNEKKLLVTKPITFVTIT